MRVLGWLDPAPEIPVRLLDSPKSQTLYSTSKHEREAAASYKPAWHDALRYRYFLGTLLALNDMCELIALQCARQPVCRA